MASESVASHRLLQPLSSEQKALVKRVLAFCCDKRPDAPRVFVIEGAPGTGKSLVMNQLFERLQQDSRDKGTLSPLYGSRNYFLVNHPEMIKLYKELSERDKWTRKKDFLRPTSFINGMDKIHEHADVVLVDEAHLLLTRPNAYTKFYQQNQLQEIIRLARKVVIVFDQGQVLKFRSSWSKDRLRQILKAVPYERVCLEHQFRMNAPQNVYQWIEDLCRKQKIDPIPSSSYLEIFDDAQAMYQKIRVLNEKYGLCRMLATYDYFYRLDGKKYYIQEGKFKLPWDLACPNSSLPWAERPQTIDEVGSVYTVQGFDLNYVGVILGPSLYLDVRDNSLGVKPECYQDGAAFAGRNDIDDVEEEKKRIMLNALYVIMTRPIHGLFLYAHDRPLREYLYRLYKESCCA